jgi:DAACS family dicarboxylate/amino acid:cation (Na+ or H+) symporter
MVAMIVGVALGFVAKVAAAQAPALEPKIAVIADRVATPVGRIFVRLVAMVVVPLVISALILGVVEIGDPRKLGRIGLRALALTAAFSLAAALIGVTLANVIRPGEGLDPAARSALSKKYEKKASEDVGYANAAEEKSFETRLLDLLPDNLMKEIVGAADGSSPGNGMLAVMVFSLLFGVAVAAAGDKAETLVRCMEGVFTASMHVIGFAMKLAPLAVACLLFSVTFTLGGDFLVMLGKFVATVLLGLAIHAFVVYPTALVVLARRSPWGFYRDAQEAALTAFATSSSNATLPVALRVAEEDLKIKPEVAKFVLTVGATGNQNGTALFEGVVVLFLAQVFGKDLDLAKQFTLVLMAVMAGIGTAGVPGGSMPLVVGILRNVKIEGSAIALVYGVDRLLDMARTAVNVVGDLVIAVCVAGMEDQPPPSDEAV